MFLSWESVGTDSVLATASGGHLRKCRFDDDNGDAFFLQWNVLYGLKKMVYTVLLFFQDERFFCA